MTTKDIISKTINSNNSFRKQVFNNIAGFNGKTYTKKVNFYIHNFNSRINFKLLNRNYAYSISKDAEEFIEFGVEQALERELRTPNLALGPVGGISFRVEPNSSKTI